MTEQTLHNSIKQGQRSYRMKRQANKHLYIYSQKGMSDCRLNNKFRSPFWHKLYENIKYSNKMVSAQLFRPWICSKADLEFTVTARTSLSLENYQSPLPKKYITHLLLTLY